MVPNPRDAGGHGLEHEIVEVGDEAGTPGKTMRLGDYIPIYIPAVEKGVLNKSRRKQRFLDFLIAHPSKDWFLRSTFVGRLRRRGPNGEPSHPDTDTGGETDRRRRHFRVPFVRKINWRHLWNYAKNWVKHPANIAMLIWLVFVGAGLLVLLMLMTGMLDSVIRSESQRKKWTEVTNQILNALFTIMCLYQHPRIFHHLVLLCRWRAEDQAEARKVYCKEGAPRPHDRAHMMVVVLLLHVTCIAQYFCCALFWSYSTTDRPDLALNIGYGFGTGSPVVAGLYAAYSPLGRKQANEPESADTEEETRSHVVEPQENGGERDIRIYNRRVVVSSPEWIGGLCDCGDDPTVCAFASLCTFCVFGWNMERLGFGNMYVHAFTFALLCVAPFLIFGAAALNINDEEVRYTVATGGALLCFCGFLYGGFWRVQMRKRFKLPASRRCCGRPAVADCASWLFCWSCALAQEVRTGNFYDVEDDRFFRKARNEDGRAVLVPLPWEAGPGALQLPERSLSCPPKLDRHGAVNGGSGNGGVSPLDVGAIGIAMERSATFSGVNGVHGGHHAMSPPLPPLMQTEQEQ